MIYIEQQTIPSRTHKAKMADQLSKREQVQLEQWIGEGDKIFEQIYSINRDGCSPETFHQLCNNQGPTVTVLYNKDGSAFGGYTSVPWRSSGAYQTDYNSFLFRLRYNERPKYKKFPIKGGSNAINDNGGYGPCFGSGHDLLAFTSAIKKSGNYFALNGSMNLNNTYDSRGVQVQEINNGHMTITELEVYKVSDGLNKELVEPWRTTPEWNQEFLETLKDEVQNFGFMEEIKISEAKILLVGPVGAGKSSFINTITSIFRGYVTCQAACGSADHSLTTKYRMYQARPASSSKPLPFILCDTRGLEETQGSDAYEIRCIIEGNMPDGYQFNPAVSFSPETPGYIKDPSVKDMIHCVAFVLDGSTLRDLPEKTLERMKAMQATINQIGLPQVVLLTKVDAVDHNIDEDLTSIFRNSCISSLVDEVSKTMGLPRGHVLPLKNYEKEHDLDMNISILALLALRQILRFSQDVFFRFPDISNKQGMKKLEITE